MTQRISGLSEFGRTSGRGWAPPLVRTRHGLPPAVGVRGRLCASGSPAVACAAPAACPRELRAPRPGRADEIAASGIDCAPEARAAFRTRSARRPPRCGITRRRRRTIGRLCCPIARNDGVRYRLRGGRDWGSDGTRRKGGAAGRSLRRGFQAGNEPV